MKKAVICFTRVPRPGQTKTRLLPILKPQQCEALHSAFLRDLSAVYESMDADLFVAYAPDPEPALLKEIFPMAKAFFPQEGADLGEKMLHAIESVLKQGYESCILTGSDLPLMTKEHLESGFTALENAAITLGPTSDGGYYLIGMKQPAKAVFRVSGYGGSTVLENTVAAAEQAGLSVGFGIPCDDVDTPEDLRLLAKTADPASHTGRCLEEFRKEGVNLS